MGFTVAKDIAEKASALALSMGNSDEAVVIPGTPDMVLVKQGSKAFFERRGNTKIFQIPIELTTVVDGVEVDELFFVCTG